MNHKVLLADDSLTIQKVIKITLANQPYDVVDCSSEEELFQKLPQIQPKIVFLDFNLSENYTGYDLTARIKALVPSAKVLMLLGTFDTVDDAAFEKCGASDKIVKPFDSNRFIAICKQLIDTFGEEEFIAPPQAKAPAPKLPDPEEQWTVNHTTEVKKEMPSPVVPQKPAAKGLNPLENEVSDWGMTIPGVIDSSEEEAMELPPVIGEEKSLPKQILPSSDDLDYPDLDTGSAPAAKSNLISIDSFRQDATSEFQLEGNYVEEESNVSSIEAQIRDEVEEDLWKADEFEDLKKDIAARIESAAASTQLAQNDFDDSLFRPIDDSESISWRDVDDLESKSSSQRSSSSSSTQTIAGPELEELVKKYVKEYMDEMFRKNVEKVAWDVIPDLAENLIRQELSKISDKVLKDSK